jgi:RNA polymerase sigma-70 factor (ECF subfamily)
VETASQAPLYVSVPRGSTASLDRQPPMLSSSSPAAIPPSRLDKIKLREFVDVVERYRPQLLWLAMRMVSRPEEAEDIVQQALLKALRKLSGFRGDSQMRTWLNAIVKNTAREFLRSQRGRTFVPLDCPPFSDEGGDEIEILDHRMNPEEYCERRERDDMVAAVIGGMGPGNREVVEMCVFQELPYMDVATALNLSLSTVKSRMFRSRRDLRMALSSQTGAFK